ncbi:intradiol ring-cleavage dioxygenase [uncultured Thiothrix sp.]|uniref:intradiol ring-cleavage dioxygenase n=1 Tax=uncultured Thiothrix sp. TaxID=223185 RepID=UPI00262585FF|nr:intradiol ring-cleavage dioxygenase [uncultured Thiothrix sp.]HMT94781.1 intradiol ring-cleavage dioxygenase [Thiolinea sp.]
MHSIDQSRRQALVKLVASSVVLSTGSAWARSIPTCILTPEQTEGPYFLDNKLERSDIRSDPYTGRNSAGVPLYLQLQVTAVKNGQCQALPGAIVDIWHCDAIGVYSGVGEGGSEKAQQRFLRGYQITGQTGKANFVTIYPGWYPGRAVHIHFKVRTPTRSGKADLLTSQLYFDEAVTQEVYQQQPYAQHATNFDRNEQDGIYRSGQGRQLLLKPEKDRRGYIALFNIGLNLS